MIHGPLAPIKSKIYLDFTYKAKIYLDIKMNELKLKGGRVAINAMYFGPFNQSVSMRFKI